MRAGGFGNDQYHGSCDDVLGREKEPRLGLVRESLGVHLGAASAPGTST